MEKVIERKTSDTHIGLTYHWDKWALPLDISWWVYHDNVNPKRAGVKCFNLDIDFLCFRFFIEHWRWLV